MKRSAALALVIFVAACEKAPPPPGTPPAPTPAILQPDPAKVAAAGPDSFVVHVVSSRGPFDVMVHRNWSPNGSDRLYYLVTNGFYDGLRFFRVIDGFMAQFGMSGDTAVGRVWRDLKITDDPVTQSNIRGRLTFATSGQNSRTTQLFINFGNNAQLDRMGFAPVGEVTNGMGAVDALYSGDGDGGDSGGKGPSQDKIALQGYAYLMRDYPKLDYIATAHVSNEWKANK